MSQRIPVLPFPPNVLKRICSLFGNWGGRLSKMFPKLQLQLDQSNLGYDAQEYSALMFFAFLFYFLIFGILIPLVLSLIWKQFPMNILIGLFIAFILSFLMLIQVSMYPTLVSRKRVKSIERNLIFAMRTLLVQIKSGVGIFEALSVVANGDYGELSIEFKNAVDEINTGTMQEVALEKIATKNPSAYLRKALYQIVNGLKAGADISSVLVESVASMTREEKLAINTYGQSLKLLSLMYMMMGVIVPALGVTFLIILGSFPGIKISEMMFWALLGGVSLAQFMFIGIIKSKRPNLMEAN